MTDGLFIQKECKVGSLAEDDQRLDEKGHKVRESLDNLMLVVLDEELHLLVLVLQHIVDALESPRLELVDKVVKGLETSDVDQTVVIW